MAKEEIVISSGDENEPPQQQSAMQLDVYTVTVEEYEQRMELMLRRSLLHVNISLVPPETLLHLKSRPVSPPHSPLRKPASKSDAALRRSTSRRRCHPDA